MWQQVASKSAIVRASPNVFPANADAKFGRVDPGQEDAKKRFEKDPEGSMPMLLTSRNLGAGQGIAARSGMERGRQSPGLSDGPDPVVGGQDFGRSVWG
jgi:hypothetical protein